MASQRPRPGNMASVFMAGIALVVLAGSPATTSAQVPVAVDDTLQAVPVGERVVVEVLLNDAADVDPTTLALIDPVTAGAVNEVVVAGEGTWSVTFDRLPHSGKLRTSGSARAVAFVPEAGFVDDPTPIGYVVSSQTGVAGQASVVLTMQNIARNDVSLGNPLGQKVIVDVLANDDQSVGLRDVRITLPFRELLVGSTGRQGIFIDLTVPGEGEWLPQGGSEMHFQPFGGFQGNPSPLEYSVIDVDGNEYFATVTVTYAGIDPDDTLLGNPVGAPLSIDVLGNDGPNIDVNSLALVDPEGGPSGAEVIVVGEGRWNVEPERRVTFAPEPGFIGDPTPIAYSTMAYDGTKSGAVITLKFQDVVRNDCSSNNLAGRTVALDVLANDDASLLLKTLAFSGPLRERREPGQTREDRWYADGLYIFGEGRWAYDSVANVITFDPESGFDNNPTPQEYTVLDTDGVEHFATMTITYLGKEAPSAAACSPAPPTTTPTTTVTDTTVPTPDLGGELPATGTATVWLAAVATLLVAIGAIAMSAVARRGPRPLP